MFYSYLVFVSALVTGYILFSTISAQYLEGVQYKQSRELPYPDPWYAMRVPKFLARLLGNLKLFHTIGVPSHTTCGLEHSWESTLAALEMKEQTIKDSTLHVVNTSTSNYI